MMTYQARASVGVGLGVVAIIVLVAFLRLRGPTEEPSTVVVGTVDDVQSREVIYLPEHGIFVVAADGGFWALSEDARHVGDRVLYCRDDETFSSPAHGERFDRLGRYLGGPARGDLGWYPLSIHEGRVVVVISGSPVLPTRSGESLPSVFPLCAGDHEDPPGFYA